MVQTKILQMTLFQNLILFTNYYGNLQEKLKVASFLKYVDLHLTSEWGLFYMGHTVYKIHTLQRSETSVGGWGITSTTIQNSSNKKDLQGGCVYRLSNLEQKVILHSLLRLQANMLSIFLPG
jgi:hypothetical protein